MFFPFLPRRMPSLSKIRSERDTWFGVRNLLAGSAFLSCFSVDGDGEVEFM